MEACLALEGAGAELCSGRCPNIETDQPGPCPAAKSDHVCGTYQGLHPAVVVVFGSILFAALFIGGAAAVADKFIPDADQR